MSNNLPIRCTPCRVNFKDKRYRVLADGSVAEIPTPQPTPADLGLQSVKDVLKWELANLQWHSPHSDFARDVRREAARLRRNRNARERARAMKDLGLRRAPGGAFHGWE